MNPAGDDRLVLGALATRARLFGRAVDQLAVERRLESVAREALPQALGTALGRALPEGDAIIRIDRVAVAFTIDRRALDGGGLAERWAGEVGGAIADRLRRGDGVARFDSYAQFVAAYLEHRFAIALHPAFAFADFAALEHLTPADAAVELLAARPVYLAALARQARRTGRATWLADRLGEPRAATLLQRILAPGLPPAPPLAALTAMRANTPTGWHHDGPARSALALALTTLAHHTSEAADVSITLALARLIVALDMLVSDSPAALASLAAGGIDPTSPTLPPALARIATLLADPTWHALAQTAAAELATDAAEPAPARKPRPAPLPKLASPFAGIALTLPMLRSMTRTRAFHPDQLRALITTMIAPAERDHDTAQALATFLVPQHDPEPAPPWPPLPHTPHPTADHWAAHALKNFADRLPGLQASSPAYLRRQFLHVPGELTLEPDTLVVRLARPPLAIVLTMSGMTGDQGPLPWLADRRLRIDLP